MPLGIFPGFLAGAGQGLVEQQKLRQQQQEAAIRNLLLQRSLKKDEEKETVDTAYGGLGWTPPPITPLSPVGGGTGSSPAMALFGTGGGFGGGDQGSAARGADTGYGPIPTVGANATFPALPPNTSNFFQTSGPGYPVNPTPLAIPANARQAPGPNDNAVMQLNLSRAAAPAAAPEMPPASGPSMPPAPPSAMPGQAALPPDAGGGDGQDSPFTNLFQTSMEPTAAPATLPVSQSAQSSGLGYGPSQAGAPTAPPGAGGIGGQPAQPGQRALPPVPDLTTQMPPTERKAVNQNEAALRRTIPYGEYENMSMQSAKQAIDRHCQQHPELHCTDATKGALMQRLMKDAKPQMQHQWQLYYHETLRREQEDRADKRAREIEARTDKRSQETDVRAEKRAKEADVRAEKREALQGWEVYTDSSGTQFEYNPRLNKARTIETGEPYKIQGTLQKSTAGATASTGRERDIEARIKQLDARFKRDNPNASEDDIADAHFKHRQDAEHGLATAKAAPARNLPMAIAQKYMEAHPDASHEDLIRLGGAVRREQSIQTAFAGGEAGRQLRSLNTLVDHISLSREYADALRNGDFPRANALVNRWAIETGHPEVNDFNAARTIMADEVVRLLTNTGGTETDRKDMQAIFDPNAAPEQLAGAMNVAQRFVTGRLTALEQQYARNDPTRQKEFREQMLTPEASRFFSTAVPTAREPQGPLLRQGDTPAPQTAPSTPDQGAPKSNEVIQNGWVYDRTTGQALRRATP
jgi:hypothetical protein